MRLIPADNRPMEPASHENPDDPGVLKRVIATRSELMRGQIQMVNWARLPAGKSFQAHYHEDMEEVFIIIKGEATMHGDQESVVLTAGDSVVIAPREIHRMVNSSNGEVEYIVFGVSSEKGGKTVVVE